MESASRWNVTRYASKDRAAGWVFLHVSGTILWWRQESFAFALGQHRQLEAYLSDDALERAGRSNALPVWAGKLLPGQGLLDALLDELRGSAELHQRTIRGRSPLPASLGILVERNDSGITRINDALFLSRPYAFFCLVSFCQSRV